MKYMAVLRLALTGAPHLLTSFQLRLGFWVLGYTTEKKEITGSTVNFVRGYSFCWQKMSQISVSDGFPLVTCISQFHNYLIMFVLGFPRICSCEFNIVSCNMIRLRCIEANNHRLIRNFPQILAKTDFH
jgi:hypothetical protein